MTNVQINSLCIGVVVDADDYISSRQYTLINRVYELQQKVSASSMDDAIKNLKKVLGSSYIYKNN